MTSEERERPYITLGDTDRPAEEEHHDAVHLLVMGMLRNFGAYLSAAVTDALKETLPGLVDSTSRAVMDTAYFTSAFGELRLMGTAEAAEVLGVQRQRVSQLWRESERFPRPVTVLKMGPVWLAADIEKFAELDRKPGRPKADA